MYTMRMGRVNVYLPDDLATEAKAAGLNISNITQEALRSELRANSMNEWLAEVAKLPRLNIDPAVIDAAVAAAKDEFEYGV